MDKRTLQKLEYPKIIELLTERCSSQLGKEQAAVLLPSFQLVEIERQQAETTEAKEIWRFYPGFTLGGIRDIRGSLHKAQIGGIIEPEEFLNIFDTLLAAKRVKAFFSDEGLKYQLLVEYATQILSFPKLEQQIKKIITPEGEVSDNASSELARLRKQLRTLQGKARDKLEHMVRSTEIQKYLQDAIITIRNDRYVIPVKQEYRSQIPGLIHDQSGSGATLFIEPMVVVELNNETLRCEMQERAEVVRILRELSGEVNNHAVELTTTLQALGHLDFVFGKAKLSSDLDCGQPKMNERGYLNILQGRHPLIQGKVVPTTIHLGKEFDTLVITGPNTGGKTVSLKTVGLFSVMAQAGLHVPAETGTELTIFHQVFADIGDEQSIEQSLSTFSSHMTNIINILAKVDNKSLILLDELGAGTDPTEGAALAMSILEHLIGLGARTIATTHYSELKSFAYNNKRVENASVEFDVETLSPTYRLLIGVPGKSNAFEISRRLGLSNELVERARGFLSQEEIRVADLIENLETNQLLSEKDRVEAERLKKLAQTRLAQVDKRDREASDKGRDTILKAQHEALEIIARARRESEAILKEVKEAAKKGKQQSNPELAELRNKLREKENQLYEEVSRSNSTAGEVDILTLEAGDMVLIKRLNQKAQVLEKPNSNGDVLVQAGIMKLTVKAKEICPIIVENAEKRGNKTGAGEIAASKARDIRNELDLRGLTVDEAIFETEKYLDDAYLAGLPQAYLIHGKGTGTLRKAIQDLVQKHRFINSARIGGYNEGGIGVTVVEFKK